MKAKLTMSSKQAKTNAVAKTAIIGVETISATNLTPLQEQHLLVKASDENRRNLFIKVDTFDAEGRTVGTRIVDMYHFGTRAWIDKHLWWAAHNSNTIEAVPATPEQVAEYVEEQRANLAAKFAKDKAHAAA